MPFRFDPGPDERAARFQRELDRTVLAQDAMPRGGEDERHNWAVWAERCGICNRDLAAVETCPVCGDHEDMAA